ncbi:hypothetical protein [Lysobacter soli]|uniref:hypothetical protein n=1 Tax=Lysobacter soli TaxID=453783 RepID=UPI00240FE043|nr:hypothetical protein [Lysobacter soli]MDG2518087.1 hypothetical protein [Lysobacter soli]
MDQCVALLRDALSNRPNDPWSDEATAWFADVAGIINAYDVVLGSPFQMLNPLITDRRPGGPDASYRTLNAQTEFVTRARSVLTQLQLVSNTFTTRHLEAGAVHDYFEEVRQLIAGATRDVLFIDPYIDATFVARYLPQVPRGGSTVRLLTAERQAAAPSPVTEPVSAATWRCYRAACNARSVAP